MFGNLRWPGDNLDLVQYPRRLVQHFQRSVTIRATLELIVLGAVDLVRRKRCTFVLGMSRLSAPLPPRPAFLSHDSRLYNVARRWLGGVAGVLLQPRQAGFQ